MLQFFKVFFHSSSFFLLLLLLLAIFNPLPANAVTTELPPEAQEGLEGLPADHFLNVLEQTLKPTGPGPADASQFNGIVKIGGFSESYRGILEVGNSAASSIDKIQQNISNNALVINAPTWRDGQFFPGIVWRTQSNNPAKPKMGIWGQMSSAGSKMFFGTGNKDIVGITNTALTIDQEGNVGIGTTEPGAKLEVVSGLVYAPTGVTLWGNNTPRCFPWDNDEFRQNIPSGNPPAGDIGKKCYDSHNISGSRAGKEYIIKEGSIILNGNVGIGTITPKHDLDIGSPNFGLQKSDVSPNAGYLRFGDKTGWKFHIGRAQESVGAAYNTDTTGSLFTVQDNGNVGIGTTAPGAKLDVNGNVIVNGTIESKKIMMPGGWGDTSGENVIRPYWWGQPLAFWFWDSTKGYNKTMNLAASGNVTIQGRGDQTNETLAVINGRGGWNTTTNLDMSTYVYGSNNPGFRLQIQDDNYGAKVDILTKQQGKINNALISRLTITPTGNVGIGTTFPEARLQIWTADDGSTFRTAPYRHIYNTLLARFDTSNTKLTSEALRVNNYSTRVKGARDLTNVGLYANAYGAQKNYAIIVPPGGGNVGIGTEAPQATLDVLGDIKAKSICLRIPGDPSGGADCRDSWGAISSTSGWAMNGNYLYTSNTSASVGIGTANPVDKLQIGNAYSFHDGGNKVIGFGYTPGNAKATMNGYPAEIRYIPQGYGGGPSLRIGIDDTSRAINGDVNIWDKWGLTLIPGGKVGIGTSTPAKTLDVNGEVKATKFCIGNDCRDSWTAGAGNTQWTTSGLNIYYLTGYVGLGTAVPSSSLTVKGAGVDGTIRIYPAANDGEASIGFKQNADGSGKQWVMGQNSWGVGSGNFAIGGNNSLRMSILENGNVGIGTGNPRELLTINSEGPDSNLLFTVNNDRRATIRAENDGNDKGRLKISLATGISVDGIGIRRSTMQDVMMFRNGMVGIDNNDPKFKLDVNGSINVAFANNAKKLALSDSSFGMDVAELFDAEQEVEEGDVLVVSPEGKKVKRSSEKYQQGLMGVVSSAPAVLFEGSELKLAPDPDRFTKGTKPPVTLAGRVHIKVNNENGSIQPGDYLTSSSVPGVAMKATEPGPTIGIALESFTGDAQGKILVFVNIGENNVGALVDAVKKIQDSNDTIRKSNADLQRRLERLERGYVKPRW